MKKKISMNPHSKYVLLTKKEALFVKRLENKLAKMEIS